MSQVKGRPRYRRVRDRMVGTPATIAPTMTAAIPAAVTAAAWSRATWLVPAPLVLLFVTPSLPRRTRVTVDHSVQGPWCMCWVTCTRTLRTLVEPRLYHREWRRITPALSDTRRRGPSRIRQVTPRTRYPRPRLHLRWHKCRLELVGGRSRDRAAWCCHSEGTSYRPSRNLPRAGQRCVLRLGCRRQRSTDQPGHRFGNLVRQSGIDRRDP